MTTADNNNTATIATAPITPISIQSRRPLPGLAEQPAPRSAPGQSVGEYLTWWLSGRQSLRPSTRLAYGIHLSRYLVPHLGAIALSALRLEDVEAMYREIHAAGLASGKPIGAATTQRIHATLMSALGSAVRRGVIDRNPALFVDLPPVPHPRMQIWTALQLSEFLTSTGQDPMRTLFLLMAITGLRRGEAVGLRWSDIDLEDGLLHVEQQIVAVGPQRLVGPPKSSRGRRPVAVPATVVAALRAHHDRQRWDRLDAGTTWVDTGLVFTDEVGAALNPTQVSRQFERLVAASGLPVLRLHDLRHTSATLGLASGETLLEVSRRLGHSSITTTADIYSQVAPATALESAQRLDHLINAFAMPAGHDGNQSAP